MVFLFIGALVWLNHDISLKKQDQINKNILQASADFSLLSDDNLSFEEWGKVFPDHLKMYLENKEEQAQATEFGGNLSYSKLIRFPQLSLFWAGYAFSIDFNEERRHFYSFIDQMDTARNHKDFLNSHGVTFQAQPAACMNCHSGWAPWIIKILLRVILWLLILLIIGPWLKISPI